VGGPIGAAVGAAVGGPVGAALGLAADSWDDAEPHFRQHYESSTYRSDMTWDNASTAYRYGFDSASNKAYQGKSYDEVRAGLQKSYANPADFERAEPLVRTAYEARRTAHSTAARTGASTSAGSAQGETVIPVVEEEIRVGKRKVEKGGVKVETSVTEVPVEEQVHLHEEHVKVNRRAVDRPLKAGDAPFKEGTIEMTESVEEAVVQKRARVIEEIVISKVASDHTETVRDTVRQTKVDVKKTAGKARASAPTWEKLSSDFEAHCQTTQSSRGMTFADSTPAYRYGYNLANDERFQGSWDEVEPEARKHWEKTNKGTWDEFKDSVRYAWESVTGQR